MEFVRESKNRLLLWQDRQIATIPNLIKESEGKMKHKIDYMLQIIQLYSYKLNTCKIGNAIMDFRLKYTLNRK